MNIQLNSAFIDFYVDRKKFEAYKTRRGRFNYVFRELNTLFNSMKSLGKEQGLNIRLVKTTPNEFWSMTEFTEVRDLGWRGEVETPKNEEYLTIRYFSVDIISVVLENKGLVNYPKFKGDNYLIECTNYQII